MRPASTAAGLVMVLACSCANSTAKPPPTTHVTAASSTTSAPASVDVPRPDPHLTPGVTLSGVTREQVCRPGYARSARHVPPAEKADVFRRYRISRPPPGAYEVDHLIPLELGGSNDVANLWPEPYKGSFGAHEKDRLEDRMRAGVCAGRLDLTIAQRNIASDWYTAWLAAGRP